MINLREKVVREIDREIIYNEAHWALLNEKREKASKVMDVLVRYGLKPYAYGSIARGDVHKRSDIDIVILEPIQVFIVEQAVEIEFGGIYAREIVQATPKNTPKALIYVDYETTITIPLISLKKTEYEFYKFGGMIDSHSIKDLRNRVKGVDKRLVLIVPTDRGHRELSIIGREEWVAKTLGISIDTVKERVKVLTKRDEVGRTGVFIKRSLSPEESFDIVFRSLVDSNPALRRLLRKRGERV